MWTKMHGPAHEFIDGETGAHVQRLRNLETGAEHITQIMVGHSACPLCGVSSAPAEPAAGIDPHAKVEADLAMLNGIHVEMKAYAAKHGLTIKGAAK